MKRTAPNPLDDLPLFAFARAHNPSEPAQPPPLTQAAAEESQPPTPASCATPGTAAAPLPDTDRSTHLDLRATGEINLTPRERLFTNLRAYRIVKQQERRRRDCTPAEKEPLRQFTGWGGIANAFLDLRKDPDAHQITRIVEKLIGGAGLAQARAGALNAHYTSYQICRFAWTVAERLGFRGGAVLEPACGIGNFIGTCPPGLGVRFTAIELDRHVAAMTRLLYPKSDTYPTGFEEWSSDHRYDLAITNVPFGNYRLALKLTDPLFKLRPLIHDYFLLRCLHELQEGGLLIAITSTGTLDKRTTTIRKLLASEAILLHAFRLPDCTFRDNADTSVTTDLLVLQKHGFRTAQEEAFEKTPTETTTGLPLNEYYHRHPDHLLGTPAPGRGLAKSSLTLTCPDRTTLQGLLDRVLGHVQPVPLPEPFAGYRTTRENLPAPPNLRAGELHVDGEEWHQCIGPRRMIPVTIPPGVRAELISAIRIKGTLRRLIDSQLEDERHAQTPNLQLELRDLVKRHIQRFCRETGTPQRCQKPLLETRTLSQYLSDDPDYYKLTALVNAQGQYSAIFTSQTLFSTALQPRDPAADTPIAELALYYRRERGHIDTAQIAAITQRPRDEIEQELVGQGLAFRNHADPRELIHRSDYLSTDNIYELLEAVRAEAHRHPDLQYNLEALRKAIPTPIPLDKISLNTRQRFFSPSLFEGFLKEKLNAAYTVRLLKTGRILVQGKSSMDRELGTQFSTYSRAFEAYANNEHVPVRLANEDGEGLSEEAKEQELLALRQTQERLEKQTSTDFELWCKSHSEDTLILATPSRQQEIATVRGHLEDRFNQTHNRSVIQPQDGRQLRFRGISDQFHGKPFRPHRHQLDFVARMICAGKGGNAHAVGLGKTICGILTANIWRQLGITRKPLFVVPKKVLGKWAREYHELFPTHDLLVIDQFDKANREILLGRIAVNCPDAIFMTQEHLKAIPNPPEHEAMIIEEELTVLREQLDDAEQATTDTSENRQLQKTLRKIQEEIARLENRLKTLEEFRKTRFTSFRELGIDSIVIDEIHYAKNMPTPTRVRAIGVPGASSQRAFDTYLKTRYLLDQHHNRGVLLLSGTPISNTIAEVYNMLKLIAHEAWTSRGIRNFDEWVAQWGEIVRKPQILVDGTFGVRASLSAFRNTRTLQQVFQHYWEFRSADDVKINRPDANHLTVVIEPTRDQQDYYTTIIQRARDLRGNKIDPRVDNWLKLSTDGRKAALDMRLISPWEYRNHGQEANSKLERIAEDVAQRYRRAEEQGRIEGQLVFFDLYHLHALTELQQAEAAAQADSDQEPDPSTATDPCDRRRNDLDLHNDLQAKLIERGVRPEHIAILNGRHNNSARDKERVQLEYNEGTLRILIGTTFGMGEGMDLQQYTTGIHHADVPLKPVHMEQREGRGVRQGNTNQVVDVIRYTVRGSFDQYLYQMISRKAKFIEEFCRGIDIEERQEDLSESMALNYEMVMAATNNNPKVRDYFTLKLRREEEDSVLRGLRSELHSARLMYADAEAGARFERKEQARLAALNHQRNTLLAQLIGPGFNPEQLPEQIPLLLQHEGGETTNDDQIAQLLDAWTLPYQTNMGSVIVATRAFPKEGFRLNGVQYVVDTASNERIPVVKRADQMGLLLMHHNRGIPGTIMAQIRTEFRSIERDQRQSAQRASRYDELLQAAERKVNNCQQQIDEHHQTLEGIDVQFNDLETQLRQEGVFNTDQTQPSDNPPPHERNERRLPIRHGRRQTPVPAG